MSEILVSIIVPVYNVENYIRRCLDSIVKQTYKNIEVILVDDGSPDSSGEICEDYAKRYPFIKVIHQKNQGQSSARNNGTKMAKGDYVTYIDSDDFVTPDYVEYLMGLLNRYDADVSTTTFVYQYDNKPIKPCKKETNVECLSPLEAIRRMNYGKGITAAACPKMYKRDLVLKYPYPVGRIYEDVATIYKILGESNRVVVGNQQIYYWIQHPGSTMHETFSERQYDGIMAVEEQLQYVRDKFPEAEDAAKYRYAAKCVELLAASFMSGVGHLEFKRLRNYANPYTWDVIHDSNAKRSIKLRLLSMWLGYLPSKFVFWIHEKMKQRLI